MSTTESPTKRRPVRWYLRLSRRARIALWLAFVAWVVAGSALFAGLKVPLISTPEATARPKVDDRLVMIVVDGGAAPAMALVHRRETSGTFVLLPPSTVVEVPGVGARYLSKAVAESGSAGLTSAVANELQIRVPVYAHADKAAVVSLVDKLGGVTVEVSKTIEAQQGSILRKVFSAGSQKLSGNDFFSYLTYSVDGQSELERLARQDAAWRGLLKGVRTAPRLSDSVFASWTGDLSNGELNGFVSSISRTPGVQYLSLPVSRVGIPGEQAYDIQANQLGPIHDQLRQVSVASEAPGRRIRLLVGADGAIGPAVARELIESGYFIATTGVASRYYEESRVVVSTDDRDRLEREVTRLLDLLGAGKMALVRNGSSDFDATVVVGRDWAAAHGFTQSSPSPSSKPRR